MSDIIKTFLNDAESIFRLLQTDEAVRTAMGQLGYSPERIGEGQALFDMAQTLTHERSDMAGKQYAATDHFYALMQRLRDTYNQHMRIARVAFKGQAAPWESLGLQGTRSKTFAPWIGQVKQFYANALRNPTFIASLAQYNITTEILEATQASIATLIDAEVAQTKISEDAQATTRRRDAAIYQLQVWIAEFRQVARVALAGNREGLDKLGVRGYTRSTPAIVMD